MKRWSCRALRVLALGCVVWCTRAADAKDYTGYRVVHLTDVTRAQLDALEAGGAVVLDCVPHPGDADVVVSPQQLATLRDLGITYQVEQENLQALIDAERAPSTRGTGDPFDDFFLDYHRYDNGTGSIIWFMNELASRYPNLATMIDIGTSIDGRTIWAMRIANDAVAGNKPGALYFSCVHAREWITTTIPPYFAKHVLESYGNDVVITDMVDHTEIFLVPVSNPDGYEFCWTDDRLWRKNRAINSNGTIGVDINRNWSEAWGIDDDGSSGSPSSATYRGPAPFSEPETRALRDVVLNHPNIRTMLDIHSFSQLILWPWGYTDALCPDDPLFREHGYAMRDLIYAVHEEDYTAGPTYTTIYAVNGDSLDWGYAQHGILGFSFEVRPKEGAFGTGFLLDKSEIIPNNEEILPAMLYLTNTDFVRSPVIIELDSEIPEVITPGQAVPLAVSVTSQYENLVPGTPRMYYRYDPAGPFNEVPLTPVSTNGYTAELPATNCSSTPEFYFAADGDGGSVVTLPRPAELAPFDPPVAVGVFYAANMDSDPGWTAQGQWAWGVPTGGGTFNHDPTSGHTGANVYGYNLSGNYADNLPATYLTTAPIDCTGEFGVELRFWRWLGVESSFGFDDATVEVSNDGLNWTVVYSAADEHATDNGFVVDTEWVHQTFDISAVADDQPTVYLRWGMGPTDGSNALPGWNIDDVVLFSKGCVAIAGDYNGDNVVSAGDLYGLNDCLTGPAGGLLPTCGVFDFDADGNVDLTDFAAFQELAAP
ncbi:MAG TPA: M14 family zinc carboxypeptidase [Phycisphaerae bacterium]|nr:M14 family zinc carboxypeptidase [Phycisphaerae bacterium]